MNEKQSCLRKFREKTGLLHVFVIDQVPWDKRLSSDTALTLYLIMLKVQWIGKVFSQRYCLTS